MLVKLALAILRRAMKKDSDYAWAWHCNIAMAAQDAGAPHGKANEHAGQLMKNIFGVNTNRFA